MLAEDCSSVGLVLLHDPVTYSDSVCNLCGRKNRSLGQSLQLFELVKTGTTPTLNRVSNASNEAPNAHWQLRGKRALRGENQKFFGLITKSLYGRSQLGNQENLSPTPSGSISSPILAPILHSYQIQDGGLIRKCCFVPGFELYTKQGSGRRKTAHLIHPSLYPPAERAL